MTQYDVSVQCTDRTREPGYRETVERIVVSATSPRVAIAAARDARPNASHVMVLGVSGSGIAFQGASFEWRAS